MPEWLTVQNVVLAAAALILAGPYAAKAAAVFMVTPTVNKGDFQKQVVTELLTLKDKLEKEGHTVASKLCKDLVIAIVYGDIATPTSTPAAPQASSLFGK
jgi:hypothetical protein